MYIQMRGEKHSTCCLRGCVKALGVLVEGSASQLAAGSVLGSLVMVSALQVVIVGGALGVLVAGSTL